MKKRLTEIVLLIFIVTLFSGFSVCPAETASKPIRVGFFELERFMLGPEGGEPNSGYSYDLLCEIAAINGWRYEFVYGSFSDLLDMLYAGEVDLLPCTAYTPERAEKLFYAESSAVEERYYITAKSETVLDDELQPSELAGKRIAVVVNANENKLLDDWLQRNGVEMELVYCERFEDTWDALNRGDADFVLNIDNAAPSGGYASIFHVGSSYSYFVASPEHQDIAEGINTAIQTIKQINPFSITHLEERYLSGALSVTRLTAGEKEWIASHSDIRVGCYTNDIPYSYTDADGNVVGAYPELLSQILEQFGVKSHVEWTLYDSMQEMHEALKNGEVDLLCSEYHRYFYSQQNQVIISDVINSVPMGMLMLENIRPTDRMRIATPETRIGILYTQEYYPNAEIVPCQSVPECIEKVISGDADIALAHTSVLEQFSNNYDERFNIQICRNTCDICFSAEPENQELIMIINRGLQMIPANSIEALEAKNTPAIERHITPKELVHDYLVYIIVIGAAIMLLIGFAVSSSMNSKKLEKHVQEITRQKELIEEKEKELILANELANQASNAKTTFLNNMSHDIRTPMNAIIGYTGMAASHIDNKERVQDYLSKINQSSNHLLSLINDVLDMSRIESGKMNLNEKPESLSEIMHSLRNIVQADIQAKKLDLLIDSTDVHDENVVCDKLRLNQVLFNVLSNAIKYTQAGGTVSVRLIQKGINDSGYGVYEFRVKDNGMGMSKEFLKTIFEPFTRVSSTTVSGIQGTGLGMAITKNIVDMFGGTIKINSEEGKGTEVILNFHFKLQAGHREPETIPELAGMRGLVADDDLNTCMSVSRMLKDIGVRCDWCTSGKEAVVRTEEAYRDGDLFKVYIIDWLMPDMNGIETVRRIRRIVGSDAPIIILTAYDWSDIEQEAREAGVSGFVSKPMFESDLRAVLAKCIGKEEKTEQIAEDKYDFTGRKILLVEDNEMNREIATEILEEDGFVVDTAEDGSVAVEKMEKARPGDYDLILMDVQMPIMDGYEATKRIRAIKNPAISGITILAMTANAFEEDRQAAIAAGMNDHLTKPINIKKMKETIAKYIL